MKKTVTTLFALATALIATAQNPSTTIATWKNDAKGAYNIIHDDFGDYGVIGIQNYADTMHFNRGLKFTFGAITSSCEADQSMYAKAKSMINDHGHEIINHSHTHSCAVGNANCGGTGTNYQWAVPGNTQKFNIEIDYSTSSIKSGTGYTPRFFIFPYDQFNENANTYLQSKGYIGGRTGAYNAAADNDFEPDNLGYFRTPLVVDVQNTGNGTFAVNLNYWVDQAITNNEWVNRELHNIGNSGWGSVSVADYRTHLNYVKSKVTSGDLWVGTISEILTYQIQKLNFTPITTYNAQNKAINIAWNTPTFDVASYLNPLQVKSPVTLKVYLNGLTAQDYVITQGAKTISTKRVKNGILYFDAYPTDGSISISLVDCLTLCIGSQPSSLTVTEGANNITFTVVASGASGITYQWKKNNVNIPLANSSSLTLNNVQLSDSGNYTVVVTSGATSLTSNIAKLKVNKKVGPLHTPYNGTPFLIPGKVEAEEFDNGGQGIAYYDLTPTNTGDATSFRNTTVDIENCTDGGIGYNLGYTDAGEWLKYTVNVTKSQNYNLEIRYANNFADNKITPILKFYLNDTAITNNISFGTTGGWANFKTLTVPNVYLKAGDNQVLKVSVVADDANINYFNFTPSVVLGTEDEFEKQVNLKVYPNPSSNDFVIAGLYEGKIEILTLEGRIINEFVISNDQTMLHVNENLAQGVYIIKYNGKTISKSIRFVKL